MALTWTPVLGGADEPVTPGRSLPHIIKAGQPSAPTNCLPYPTTPSLHSGPPRHEMPPTPGQSLPNITETGLLLGICSLLK
ncbi:hypothetical protein E2C01_090611 [Portunus trituberculatus]|uniref:Uncharacterized protein n=1 Tax=Portunus trituberculatus TaxID=210409 RepID=A0A5B7JLT7_PORTR|nr:hypothetical protein [Portunus trituberculatus]